MICPLYKSALISAVDSISTLERWLDLSKTRTLIKCDKAQCAAWNSVTGLCGMNNQPVTPYYKEG